MPAATALRAASRWASAGRAAGRHDHHGQRPVLQHARPDEIPQKGRQRGDLCGRNRAAHGAVPPEISFRFLRDGKQQYVTPGDGDLRSAVYAVLGREFARDLLAVDGGSGSCYHVTGLVTPRACRASRGAQHFFCEWPLCQEPHDHGRAGRNAYRHDRAGKFPVPSSCWKCRPTWWMSMFTRPRRRSALHGRAMSLTQYTAPCAPRLRPPAAGSAALRWATRPRA